MENSVKHLKKQFKIYTFISRPLEFLPINYSCMGMFKNKGFFNKLYIYNILAYDVLISQIYFKMALFQRRHMHTDNTLSWLINACFIMPPPTLGGQRHYVFRLSICVSVCSSICLSVRLYESC